MHYFTRAEVARHNTADDCWLIAHGLVFCLSGAMRSEPFELCKPILEKAGEDVSHWFTAGVKSSSDSGTNSAASSASASATSESSSSESPSTLPVILNLKTYVHPVSNRTVPYTPEGRFVHVPLMEPVVYQSAPVSQAWWTDEKCLVGCLTHLPRTARFINTLTGQEHVVEVCEEDKVSEIQSKFYDCNAHAKSYVWKAILDGGALRPLDPDRTLTENGLSNDVETMETLGLDPLEKDNLPTILLYFSDDLTVA